MKSKIKFDINQSTKSVQFLDVEVSLQHGKIVTTVYSKPTDSHVYLDVTSCHPLHVIKNIPKGQFQRLRRICSNSIDFIEKCNRYIQFFINRGYDKSQLIQTAKEVSKMDRMELLSARPKRSRDEQTIFVTTWHPKLSNL